MKLGRIHHDEIQNESGPFHERQIEEYLQMNEIKEDESNSQDYQDELHGQVPPKHLDFTNSIDEEEID